MNVIKTRMLTSTSGASALPAILRDYGQTIHDEVELALNNFSVDKDGNGVEVVDGLRLLGQPLGSADFAERFIATKIEENFADAKKLLEVVKDKHTALRLFSQCTLHKLPHLLGSEVLYRFQPEFYKSWNEWTGPLATGIDRMVESVLASLTNRRSLELDSMFIAYMTIAQGGLGLMDAFTRAVPDFVITM